MRYRSKEQMNVLLSRFLNNGLKVLSAQLGINRSEIVRMALFNLLKDTYSPEELDWFAGRDDVVDEWIQFLQSPTETEKFKSETIRSEEKKDEDDKYNDLYHDEIEKKLKPIKKKYAITYAEEFLRNTGMSEKEAIEFFKLDFKEKQRIAHQYTKAVQRYMEKEFPKEKKELDDRLKQLTGKTWNEMQEKRLENHINYMIQYHKDGVKAYKDQPEKLAFEKEQLKYYQEIKKQLEKKQVAKEKAEELEKYKSLYLKKYGDDPGLEKLIKEVDDPEVLENLRGVRNREVVFQLLIPAYNVDDDDDIEDFSEVEKKEKEAKKDKNVKKKN
jgi:hypothetical protein